jgi:hypothetical protein
MPYSKPSDVPDNVPVKYKPQFMEVWNSAYAAAIADKKSPAQAEETAFAQAHGVILKAKKKDERDVSADGPGFGPAEKKSEDGGQVSDPQQTLRYSEDQARTPDGKFGSGTTSDVHEHESVVQTGKTEKQKFDEQYAKDLATHQANLKAAEESVKQAGSASGSGVLSKEEHDKQFDASYTKTMNELNAKKDSGRSPDPNANGWSHSKMYHDIYQPAAHELTADKARKEGALAAWSAHHSGAGY